MAFALPFLPYIAAAVGAVGAISSASAASDAANYNTAIADRNATISTQQGEANALQQTRLNYLKLSKIKAAGGASGGTQEGSALDILESSAEQAELDVQNIRYEASLKSMGYNETAQLQRTAAKTAQREGLFKAAGAALSPFGGENKKPSMDGTGTKMVGSFESSNPWG